jgi:hypothetical protein
VSVQPEIRVNASRRCGDVAATKEPTMTLRYCCAAAAVLAVTACGGESNPAEPDGAPPAPRIHLEMTTTIAPGTEVEHCKFVTVPDSWVSRDEIDFSSGSHHVLLYQTPYTAIPTAKDDGTPVDTSGVFDCSDGPTNGWSITKLVGGSQNADGDSLLHFPAGVGIHVGGVLMINVHYINSQDQPLTPLVGIDLFTMEADEVETEGDILFLYNPLISVPPLGTARARWSCPVYADITIANAQSHMHARGVDYAARVDDAAPFYVNDRWSNVPVEQYESFVVPAGSRLDYYCDYTNSEDRAVYQGPRSTDEMCMLLGSYYPADERTAACMDPTGQLPGGDWIGNGTASCAQTLGCLQGAADFFAITDCMLAATPAVAHPASELLRCLFVATDPEAECGPQIQACVAT